MLLTLRFLGWLVARTPETFLQGISACLGDFIVTCMPRRRRVVLSNLHHAFPDRPASWRRAVGRESCRRLVETGLLSLVSPFLDERRYRGFLSATPELIRLFAEHRARPGPMVVCSPHFAYWEALTAMSLVVPGPFPEFGIIFRPLDNEPLNSYVKQTRERFGMTLLSRKEGFAAALKILRRRGCAGVLFDQNSGPRGALTLLCGRVCSTTELPGLMAAKLGASVQVIYPVRRAFWRIDLAVKQIRNDGTSAGVTIATNRWLEKTLAQNESLCASWLWAHDRWRHQNSPYEYFHLASKRNLLPAELRQRGLKSLPRRTRIWVRMPNWLGDVVMTVPLLRALRVSRPDAEITLVVRSSFLPLLAEWKIADRLHALPPRGPGYFMHFHRLRAEFADVWLLFTHSVRGDLEAWLTGCRQRFGLVRAGKFRPLLTHGYAVPAAAAARHQLEVWADFLGHFGLAVPPDRTPLPGAGPLSTTAPIGLIAGSENSPDKRWPAEHWRSLIAALPEETFVLFGTDGDRPVTTAIADGFDSTQVENLAGRTDLPAFAERLRTCRLVVANDTGGMHLANVLGVPVVALFGPTDPGRTGPVFSSGDGQAAGSSVRILRPPRGEDLRNLEPASVLAGIRDHLSVSVPRV